MTRRWPRWVWQVAVLSVFYAVGVVSHLLPPLLPLMLVLTPWFLSAAGAAVVLLSVPRASWRSFLVWVVPVYAATFFLEAAGVATGLIFGPYHYTDTLGTLFWGVPPVIGWNWVLVVLGAHLALKSLVPLWPAWLRSIAAGLVCVAFDLLLEPVAIGLRYWVWDGGSVPLQNYAAWGVIAAAAAYAAERLLPPVSRMMPIASVMLQAVFFAVLGMFGVKA